MNVVIFVNLMRRKNGCRTETTETSPIETLRRKGEMRKQSGVRIVRVLLFNSLNYLNNGFFIYFHVFSMVIRECSAVIIRTARLCGRLYAIPSKLVDSKHNFNLIRASFVRASPLNAKFMLEGLHKGKSRGGSCYFSNFILLGQGRHHGEA